MSIYEMFTKLINVFKTDVPYTTMYFRSTTCKSLIAGSLGEIFRLFTAMTVRVAYEDSAVTIISFVIANSNDKLNFVGKH